MNVLYWIRNLIGREELSRMEYEIGESVTHLGYYSAEAVNYDGDGEIYTTVFLGPRSKERAEEFAAWQAIVTRKTQGRGAFATAAQ